MTGAGTAVGTAAASGGGPGAGTGAAPGGGPGARDAARTADPFGDLRRLSVRAVRREIRAVDGVLVNLALPVLMILLFVTVFGGAIDTGPLGAAYVSFVTPGLLLMAGGYGAALTAVSIADEMTTGMIDRFRTLPIGGWAVPASHVVASLARNLTATALALVTAVALGFRSSAGVVEWALAAALVTGYVLALSSMAVVWGLLVRSTQGAGGFSFVLLFLPYLSDAIVPASTLPAGLRAFAEHQPITPIVTAMRGLLTGTPIGDAGWVAALWLAGAVAVSVPCAAVLFRRKVVRQTR